MKFSEKEELEIQERLASGPDALPFAFFWLGAALAIRRGDPIESVKFQSVGEGPSAEEASDMLKSAYEHIRDMDLSTEVLDAEIRVSKEHLRRGGWPVNEGVMN